MISDKSKELLRDYLNDRRGFSITEVISIKEVSGWTDGGCTTCSFYEEGVEIECISTYGLTFTWFLDKSEVLLLLHNFARENGILSD